MSEPEIRQFEASDGYRFHYRHWEAASDPPAGYVVALHGIQSHSGWYDYSSRRLSEAGFEVRFLDRRGSGLNQVDRGHAPHADRLVGDVVQMLKELRIHRDRNAPDRPIVLLGVSWGGKLAAVTGARRPDLVDGLALLYPGICARFRPRWHQRRLLDLAVSFDKQRTEVPIPLDDPVLFTGEPQWQQFIRDDTLALRTASVGLLQASRQLDEAARDAAGRIHCPTLLMLAGRDRIIDNAATRRWFERVAARDRTLIEYMDAQHTLEFEPKRERIFTDLLTWLRSVRPHSVSSTVEHAVRIAPDERRSF